VLTTFDQLLPIAGWRMTLRAIFHYERGFVGSSEWPRDVAWHRLCSFTAQSSVFDSDQRRLRAAAAQ